MTTFTNNDVASGAVIYASDHNEQGARLAAVLNGNVDANNLASSAVTTAKIADSNVTTAKLADDAVTAAKIANYDVPYQTDNANSIGNTTSSTNVILRAGWGQVVGAGTDTITDAVTFPTAFTTVLGVVVTLNTSKATTAMSSITDNSTSTAFSGSSTSYIVSADKISNTGFNAVLHRDSGTFGATVYYGYSWLAWGI